MGLGFVDAAGVACSGRWLARVARSGGKPPKALAEMFGCPGSSEMVVQIDSSRDSVIGAFFEVVRSAAAVASAGADTSVGVNLVASALDAWIDFDVRCPHAGSDIRTDLALTVSSTRLSLYALMHSHTW